MNITEREVEDRAIQFWADIKGIVVLLNKINRNFKIIDHRDPTVTQYLLWRILMENKLSNQKIDRNILREFKKLFNLIP